MDDENNQQKELFEFKPSKRRFPRLTNIFRKADFEGKVSVTLGLEKILFISIGIIMLMVVVYALGVERGKGARPISAAVPSKTIAPHRPAQGQQPLTAQHAFPVPQPAADRPTAQMSILNTAPVPGIKTTQPRQSAVAAPYTIVAATFMHKDTAAQEMNRFKSEGLEAFVVQSGKFFQVCVGQFASRESGQGTLLRVMKRFKDAYIKLR